MSSENQPNIVIENKPNIYFHYCYIITHSILCIFILLICVIYIIVQLFLRTVCIYLLFSILLIPLNSFNHDIVELPLPPLFNMLALFPNMFKG
jgi:hypothetical protein